VTIYRFYRVKELVSKNVKLHKPLQRKKEKERERKRESLGFFPKSD